jgi:hypothetical protein
MESKKLKEKEKTNKEVGKKTKERNKQKMFQR